MKTQRIQSNSSFSGELVQYYDRFFLKGRDSEKSVEKETNYILSLFEACNKKGKKLLDVGCGTGMHDEFFITNYDELFGIDISKDMIEFANKNHANKKCVYKKMDITCESPNGLFENVVSLSHVIGYQYKNKDVESMLSNINKVMPLEGVFCFNFYNLSAIYKNGLNKQRKIVEDKESDILILRESDAKLNGMENTIYLKYNYDIKDNGQSFNITINEKMRCFSLLEIEYYLEKSGFSLQHSYNHMTRDILSENDWNACVVAIKVEEL